MEPSNIIIELTCIMVEGNSCIGVGIYAVMAQDPKVGGIADPLAQMCNSIISGRRSCIVRIGESSKPSNQYYSLLGCRRCA
ncbi:MAG: hypothetical protein ACW98J_08985, partial [Candidatus Thorarchaeota archaeon]